MRILFFSCFIIFVTSTVIAESITLQTYYPSPTGTYNILKTKKLCVGADCITNLTTPTDNNLYVQGHIGIGNANPIAGLHVGNKNPSSANFNSINDMIVSRNLWVDDSLRATTINTTNLTTTHLTTTNLTLTSNAIKIPKTIPQNYVLVSQGNGNATWKHINDLVTPLIKSMIKSGSYAPAGTLRNFWLGSGGGCPSGYGKTTVQINVSMTGHSTKRFSIHSCAKN